MSTFVTGKTYTTRSVCDHECIISVTIARRTAKTVTLTKAPKGNGQTTFRLQTDSNGVECFNPWGSYSMAPQIAAN